MNDFQLKAVLTSLSAVIFAFIFIMLALVLPTDKSHNAIVKKDVPASRFDKMSKSMRDGFNR